MFSRQRSAWPLMPSRATPSLHARQVLDVSDFALPLTTDEPTIPMARQPGARYADEATQRWSVAVGRFDGFIFVTPQYNWGYPAALKNALDKLFHEWGGKPAVVVSYGSRGGGKAAAQLKEVLTGLRMRVCELAPACSLKGPTLDDGESMGCAIESGTLLPRLLEQWTNGAEAASVREAWVELHGRLHADGDA